MSRMKKQHHDGRPHNDRRGDQKELPGPAILVILLLSLVCLAAAGALLR
jgi:hypothetical protein